MRRFAFVLVLFAALSARAEPAQRYLEARVEGAGGMADLDISVGRERRTFLGGALAVDFTAPLGGDKSAFGLMFFGAELGAGQQTDVTGSSFWGTVRYDFGGGYARRMAGLLLSGKLGFGGVVDSAFALGSELFGTTYPHGEELLGAQYGLLARVRADGDQWAAEAEVGFLGAGAHELVRGRWFVSPGRAIGLEVSNVSRPRICMDDSPDKDKCLAAPAPVASRSMVGARVFYEWSLESKD